MDAREVPGTRAGVFLRDDNFDLITRVLGCESDAARARLLDVDPKTIWRARRGVIGEELIAKTLDTMRRNADRLAELGLSVSFETVFAVGEKKRAA